MASAAVRRPPSLRESSPPRVRIFPTLVYRCTGVDFRLLSGLMPHEDPRGGRTDTASPEFTSIRRHPARTSNRPLSEVATFGAGTIIRDCNGSPSLPCSGWRVGPPGPRETERYRESLSSGDLRVSTETGTLSGSYHRPPDVTLPFMVRPRAPAFEYGRFQIAYGVLRRLDRRSVGVATHASRGWRIQGRVRRRG